MIKLKEDFAMNYVDFDQCMCGASARKTTRLMATAEIFPAVRAAFASLYCDGNHMHEPIVGEPVDGVFRSSSAAAYPVEMNRRLAEVFASRFSSPLVAWASFFPNVNPLPVFSAVRGPASEGGGASSKGGSTSSRSNSSYKDDAPSYKGTLDGPEAPLWRRAREEEIDNLFRHGAVTEVPEDSLGSWDKIKLRAWEVIDTIWVHLRKRDGQGNVCRHKGRCALRGDQQNAKAAVSGQDLNSFAPTCRHSTFRLLNALGCIRGARKRSFDVEAAFLQGVRDKEAKPVYARPPPGGSWSRRDERGVPIVWRLDRPLYGSSDAARIWYKTLDHQLVMNQQFTRSEYDPCYYYKVFKDGTRIDMALYVDDSWVVDNAGALADAELENLSKAFKLTVQENPKSFLGMNVISHSRKRTTISSHAYILKLASTYMLKPAAEYPRFSIPADRTLHQSYDTAIKQKALDSAIDDSLKKIFPSLVGALMYVVPSARPDVAHAVNLMARVLHYPTSAVLACAHRVLAYLQQHAELGVTFDGDTPSAAVLHAYSDSDWGIEASTSGSVVKLAGAAVAWASRRQHSIAMSSTEAEIIAASETALEIVYLRQLLAEMGCRQEEPTILYVDNKGAIELSRDLKSCNRSRHVERRYLKVRELVAAGDIEVKYVPTKDNPADIFTKSTLSSVDATKHMKFIMNY